MCKKFESKDKRTLILIGRCIDMFRDRTCIASDESILNMIRENIKGVIDEKDTTVVNPH